MKTHIKTHLFVAIIFLFFRAQGQDENSKFGFILNVAPIPTMGWEYGFEFELSSRKSFRTTASITNTRKPNNYLESYRYINQYIIYTNDDRKGLNFGPVMQLTYTTIYDDFNSKNLYYYGYGLGGAIGYKFMLGKKFALIPNLRLMANYLSYKQKSSEPTLFPFSRTHPNYEIEPKLVVYLNYTI